MNKGRITVVTLRSAQHGTCRLVSLQGSCILAFTSVWMESHVDGLLVGEWRASHVFRRP